MSVVAPPEPPRPEELELLIREARQRQRKRWLGAAAVIALLAGVGVVIDSVASGGHPRSPRVGGLAPAVRTGKTCGIRVQDMRIVNRAGRTLYREPGTWNPSYPHPSVVRCSGPTVWVVWDNGAAMSQEGYVGVRSNDAGHTWRLVFAERYFGVNAPHELDSYLGPWILKGRIAYFTGSCPACSPRPTVSLWVTKDGGRTFRRYTIPALTGFAPDGIRVSGDQVTIRGKRFSRGVAPRKTVTTHLG